VSKAREFLEFWIQNSVHPAEQRGVSGASQSPEELKARCIEIAGSQDLSLADLEAEDGDLYQHIEAARRPPTMKPLRTKCAAAR
jgi:hypothetical protein